MQRCLLRGTAHRGLSHTGFRMGARGAAVVETVSRLWRAVLLNERALIPRDGTGFSPYLGEAGPKPRDVRGHKSL